MSADCPQEAIGIGGEARKIVAMLKRRPAIDFALRLDHREGVQIGPLLRFMQTRQLIEGITTPRLDSSMILLHGFRHRMRCPVRRCLELDKEIAQRIGQIRLVVLEC
ncbi:MAG: hypothetical protein FWG81_02820 [Betaproteobacteria bacterium]|nr:hypothetical protein [Betaproteobacteria bacterium]